jgi:cytochrome c-type biogenesis protein CcsB
MIVLLLILGIGGAIGTFIENDFGSAKAKELIYHSYWYSVVFILASINLILVLNKTKMLVLSARTIFHLAFILILIGAGITHYFGLEGYMFIREGERSNVVVIGEEKHEVPFYIYLKDFELIRYPGSQAPSEYLSYVKIIDEAKNLEEDAGIYMNNTLKYGGYKFFQTSYDTDELGTQLTVNKDPGVEVSYMGYFLLFLGLIWNLFDKNSRFQFLLRKIGESTAVSILIPLFFFLASSHIKAQEYSTYVNEYLEDFKLQSAQIAIEFGTLVVQDPDGRMKPLDSQNREILYKLTGRGSWNGMTANQVILGMFSRPKLWQNLHIIKVKTPKLKAVLGMEKGQKMARFNDFFDDQGNYIIAEEVERANQLVPSRRGTYERDLIKVDERLNVAFMSIRGVLLNIYPIPSDQNNTWVDFKTMFSSFDDEELKQASGRLLDDAYNRNFENTTSYIEVIKKYQKEYGALVLPSDKQIETEIWYNQSNLFIKISLIYLLFGFVLLIYSLISIFNNKVLNKKVSVFLFVIGLVLIAIHSFGIGIRWYIGGYAPLSNTYETMIFIAFSAVIAGVFFFRKSIIAMSAAMMVAGIFIFSAYLGEIDPKITSLVPVLKSFWLSLHVSVITASYGFFGVGMLLGIFTLILFSLRNQKREHIDQHIQSINYINEVTLILGLSLLVIGNFLGGIWANESWGRYWGWDPKETWAYVSIIVYTIVLHMRLLKKYYSPYLFTVLSVVAFFSILMTYYGVNFYLAGLHSYATGDPVPIPSWVYYSVGSLLFLIVISYPKRKLTY